MTPPPAGAQIWEITGGEVLRGLFDGANAQPGPPPPPPVMPPGALLVVRISQAIGILEGVGHFGPFALVLGNLLNAVSGAIFGVTMTVVAADLARRTGWFNLTLGALGVAISVGASLSTFFTGISAAAFGARTAALGLALIGLCGLLLLWVGMPETRPQLNRTAWIRPPGV